MHIHLIHYIDKQYREKDFVQTYRGSCRRAVSSRDNERTREGCARDTSVFPLRGFASLIPSHLK